MTPELLWICLALVAVSFLYASVGHAGASGYLAVFALAGMAPEVLRPTALALNLLVAALASWQFARAGHFRWRLFWPFAFFAVPLAFVGGYWELSGRPFRLLVAFVLLLSAVRLLWKLPVPEQGVDPPLPAALGAGGCVGLLAGLTGTGGGIFLTPLMLFRGWATPQRAAATSALFILCNSAAGLLGNFRAARSLPEELPLFAVAVVTGGAAGSYLGSRKFPAPALSRLLAVVLSVAGAKLLFS